MEGVDIFPIRATPGISRHDPEANDLIVVYCETEGLNLVLWNVRFDAFRVNEGIGTSL